MIHEVTQAANKAAAVVKWRRLVQLQLLTSWIDTGFSLGTSVVCSEDKADRIASKLCDYFTQYLT